MINNQFTDEEFMSVTHKEMVLTDWSTFIRNGFQLEHFTSSLYNHLHLHCGFIAHYNQPTFWEYFFNADANRFLAFLNQFGGDRRSAETGMPGWWVNNVGDDVTEAMIYEMSLIHDELAEALISEADARYTNQKWTEINKHWDELATDSNPNGPNTHTLSSLAKAYEQALPFEVYGNYMQIKPESREGLHQMIEQTTLPQQDLFALCDWRRARQEEVATEDEDVRQSSAPGRQDTAQARQRRLNRGTGRLARRRRLSTEAETHAKRQPPVPTREEERYASLSS